MVRHQVPALLALSEAIAAMMPRTSPWPKFSVFFSVRTVGPWP